MESNGCVPLAHARRKRHLLNHSCPSRIKRIQTSSTAPSNCGTNDRERKKERIYNTNHFIKYIHVFLYHITRVFFTTMSCYPLFFFSCAFLRISIVKR